MRLDASVHKYIIDFLLRVLTSIQLGMRNHEWVPVEVISRIAKLRGGQTYKVIRKLLKNKFVVHTGKRYDGYKLAYLGYDYLALQTFIKRGILKDVICKIGVGKQSDIYKCVTPQGENVVLKLTRLGRNSFRTIKKNRQYIGTRTNYNWLYLSRLSSVRQFLFMQLLHQNNFETPTPIDTNRHAIVMSLVDGQPLCHIQRIDTQQGIKVLFEKARSMLIDFAANGLIHSDYNEFNLMSNSQGTKLTVIDFPQCVSVNHPNASTYFNRDVECVYKFFDRMVERQMSDYVQVKEQGDMTKDNKRFILNVADYPMPVLDQIQIIRRLDREIKTKGHITLTEEKQLQKAIQECKANNNNQDIEQQQSEGESVDDQGQSSQNQQQQKQGNKQSINKQSNYGRQLKKMSFDNIQGQLQTQFICLKKNQAQEQQIYDKQLQLLMSQLNHKNLKPDFSQQIMQNDPFNAAEEQQQQQDQQQRPQFKGLTAYQVRQKIKEEKKQQREKRKTQMTEDQFIKNAVKKSKKKFSNTNNLLGNRGNKNKNKANAEDIKYGYQMM